METLSQVEPNLNPAITRKVMKIKLSEIDKKSMVGHKLPSIKNTKRVIHLSFASDTPRVKPTYSVSPTRFPSIFKKYSQLSPVWNT